MPCRSLWMMNHQSVRHLYRYRAARAANNTVWTDHQKNATLDYYIIITCAIIFAFDRGVIWDHHNLDKKKNKVKWKEKKCYHFYLNSVIWPNLPKQTYQTSPPTQTCRTKPTKLTWMCCFGSPVFVTIELAIFWARITTHPAHLMQLISLVVLEGTLAKKQQLNFRVDCAFDPTHGWQCEILLLFSKTWDISSPPTDQSSHQRNKKFCGLFTSSSDSSPSAFLTETWWNLMGTFGRGFPLLKTYLDKVIWK